MTKSRTRAEFGDFQTPLELAHEVCGLLAETGFSPASVLEPTCGEGSFLVATAVALTATAATPADESIPADVKVVSLEANPRHVKLEHRFAYRQLRIIGKTR